MAAKGYPLEYKKGSVINNLEQAAKLENVTIIHSGTKLGENNQVLANGGRVLSVTAIGDSLLEAQKKAYAAVDTINWPDGFCRRDIGWRAV